jgi:hypothetical protein
LVEYHTVRIDDGGGGLAVSLGNSLLFYTTDKRFQRFDGQRFDSLDVLQATLRDAAAKAAGMTLAA